MIIKPNRKTAVFIAIPFLLFGMVILFCIMHFGVNVPIRDEWNMLPLYQKVDNHSLHFSDLWALHNDHRILFPNTVMLIAAYTTHWNVKAELYISFVFSAITALMLYLLILYKIRKRSLAILASVLIAGWLYSPIQYQNWLLGWQLEWFMCITGVVLSIFFLDRLRDLKKQKLYFCLAIASAVLASYSLGDGILIWPIGLLMLIFNKQTKKVLSVWLLTAILATTAYYYNFQQPYGIPHIDILSISPLNLLKYTFGYIGATAFGQTNKAILIGGVLLAILIPVLVVVWRNRDEMHKFAPWLSLVLLGLSSGIITGIARISYGVNGGTISRYTTFSLLYLVGLVGLICAIIGVLNKERLLCRTLIAMLVGVMIPLLITSYVFGFRGFKNVSSTLLYIQMCTHKSNPDSHCLTLTATRPQMDLQLVNNRINYVRSKHWAGY